MKDDSIEYDLQEARKAVVEDPAVGELGIDIELAGSKVLITGTVPTAARRKAAEAAVTRVLPDMEIRNEIDVADHLQSPTTAEDLP